jgi:hypothetical protein
LRKVETLEVARALRFRRVGPNESPKLSTRCFPARPSFSR